MQAAVPVEKLQEKKQSFVDELKTLPIALHTDKANEQHYEVRLTPLLHVQYTTHADARMHARAWRRRSQSCPLSFALAPLQLPLSLARSCCRYGDLSAVAFDPAAGMIVSRNANMNGGRHDLLSSESSSAHWRRRSTNTHACLSCFWCSCRRSTFVKFWGNGESTAAASTDRQRTHWTTRKRICWVRSLTLPRHSAGPSHVRAKARFCPSVLQLFMQSLQCLRCRCLCRPLPYLAFRCRMPSLRRRCSCSDLSWGPLLRALAPDPPRCLRAEMYCDKLRLTDGLDVLELGCGWGSFSLFAVRLRPYFVWGMCCHLGRVLLQAIL